MLLRQHEAHRLPSQPAEPHLGSTAPVAPNLHEVLVVQHLLQHLEPDVPGPWELGCSCCQLPQAETGPHAGVGRLHRGSGVLACAAIALVQSCSSLRSQVAESRWKL